VLVINARFSTRSYTLAALDRGRWSDCPDYVRHTAGISRECVRSLASFGLSAHDLDVATAKWTRPARAPNGAPAPPVAASDRASRLCRLCHQGVGDELHVVAECEAYTAIRQSHADLFVELGGWMQFPRHDVSNTQFRAFMQHCWSPNPRWLPSCVHVGSGGGKRLRMMLFLPSACHHLRMPELFLRKSVSFCPDDFSRAPGANESTPWVCERVGVAPYTGRFGCLLPRAYVVHDVGVMQKPHPAAYVQQGPQFSTQRKITV